MARFRNIFWMQRKGPVIRCPYPLRSREDKGQEQHDDAKIPEYVLNSGQWSLAMVQIEVSWKEPGYENQGKICAKRLCEMVKRAAEASAKRRLKGVVGVAALFAVVAGAGGYILGQHHRLSDFTQEIRVEPPSIQSSVSSAFAEQTHSRESAEQAIKK